ncbi:MAG TPA: serine/threonine-protein kinase [Polyangia bacterium]|nr:serine/threonine-protein kinase [Polyangia bacterium]
MKRLGRYQIIGRLATGGMAEVYLALSGDVPGFRTLVVVKRILPHLASNAQFIRMFLDEARLAALLDHPNIVRIIEVGHDGEDYFLVMELVQGKPMSAVLRKAAREHRPPSPALTSYLISQAAHGLAYAHTLTDGEGRPLGVVHRDVSPQNVLISFEGAVKMIDFGVARAFGRVAHTSPGGLKGKIDYMSPEQASAEEVDHRADVFALGVVLWEALTGRRLFRRETELATMRAIVDDPIPHPSEIATTIPQELDAIVMRALRKRKDARFASAQEMAVALERFAFSNNGFSPMQVAAYTKSLFSAEYLQWRKTATAALDLEVEKPQQNDQAMAGIGAEPPTAGPTMALRPGVAWQEGRSELRSASGRSRSSPSQGPGRSRSQSAHSMQPGLAEAQALAASAVAAAAPRRDRTWLYAVVGALLAIAGGGALMLTRHQEAAQTAAPPAVIPAAAPSAEITKPAAPNVEPAVARAPAPAPSPAPAGTTAAAAVPPPGGSSAPDSATWKALSRSQKAKSTSAHRHARPRPAGADATDGAGDKDKAASAAAEAQKADPFAD